ncbi:MAG: hypothetical protein F6K53_05425 [Moorea sp. SIO4A1]|nr:hypothetical protein [Moorena sp. SIO4A1]
MDKESQSRFKDVYSEIEKCYKSKAKGCMYTAISKLSPDNYQEVCEHFKITQDSTIKDDLQFFKKYFIDDNDNDWSNNMDRLLEDRVLKDRVLELFCKEVLDKPLPEEDPLTQCLRVTPEPWLKLYFIIFVSIIVIGCYALLKSVIVQQTETKLDASPKPSQAQLKDSILCLVVPSDKLSGLNQGNLIPSNRVKELISFASYFLCDGSVEAIEQKVNLKLSPDSINYSSDEDAYIQLTIYGGENIIGKKTKFELRKNLPDGDAKIDQIGRILKKYGLENFICA